ncbi:uncharacterized protein LOC135823438 [Sycon ciliatum]|uniref:uncharacterized protein LOC135823438 n=1 Tax=Sycon ciliatum TaxID=27933 RepID=UPI0031F6B17D
MSDSECGTRANGLSHEMNGGAAGTDGTEGRTYTLPKKLQRGLTWPFRQHSLYEEQHNTPCLADSSSPSASSGEDITDGPAASLNVATGAELNAARTPRKRRKHKIMRKLPLIGLLLALLIIAILACAVVYVQQSTDTNPSDGTKSRQQASEIRRQFHFNLSIGQTFRSRVHFIAKRKPASIKKSALGTCRKRSPYLSVTCESISCNHGDPVWCAQADAASQLDISVLGHTKKSDVRCGTSEEYIPNEELLVLLQVPATSMYVSFDNSAPTQAPATGLRNAKFLLYDLGNGTLHQLMSEAGENGLLHQLRSRGNGVWSVHPVVNGKAVFIGDLKFPDNTFMWPVA